MTTRRREAWLGTGAATVAALLLAGCGSSSNSATTGKQGSVASGSALATIRNAADTSGAAKGFAGTSTISLVASGQTINIQGTTSYDAASKSYSIKETMSGGSLPSQLSGQSFTGVGVGQTIYVKLPSSVASELPTPWLSMTYDEIGKYAGIQGLGSLIGAFKSQGPAQTFGHLKALSGKVTKVGTATINGVATTEYQANIQYSKLASFLGGSVAGSAASLTAELKKLGITSEPINIWVDGSGLVRRILVNVKSSEFTEKAQTDFTSFGPQPSAQAPPASQVTDISKLAAGLGG